MATTAKVETCAKCGDEILCWTTTIIDGKRYHPGCVRLDMTLRNPAPPSRDILDAAQAAIERMASDTRTAEQQIEDAAAFVCDTRLGGS